ncbi:MAG TPA: VWA domain-containing protein [Sedimentisphaerales bacterium]|nr:VWA domain-containing protein [Sedimentisphaerales bacterium]
MNLGNDNALWLLFAVPLALIPAYVWCFWRKARALRILASNEMLAKINNTVSLRKQIVKACLLIAAFVCIVVALTEPKWNPQPQQVRRKGRDVAILLDTSRSMLAEDITPNRLERSKIAILDLLEILKGDRIAIITFAGVATVKCPLTQDYAFVRMALADISTESTSRGGTMIGDAIRKAADEVFDKQSRLYKDIILITDGEDHDSFPVQAAQKAAEDGVRIVAIGLGDPDAGSRIPIAGSDGEKTFLKYKGQEVWTKLDGETLREVAYATEGGKYLSVLPGTTLDLGRIYEDLIASAEGRELESMTMMKYDEKFQIFVAIALVLLIGEVLVSERRRSGKLEVGNLKSEALHIRDRTSKTRLQTSSSVLILLAVLASGARADSSRQTLREGNGLYADGKYSEAINKYNDALVERPQAMEPKFNKGNSYYRLDDLGEALDLYQEVAAKSKDMKLVAKAKYNVGNCFFQRGAKQRDSDLQKAVDDMKTSITHWRQVLEIDPKNEKAARNIEVARLTIKDILDQIKNQQDQQDPNQPRQPQQDPNQPQDSDPAQDSQQPQDPNQAEQGAQPQDPNETKDQDQQPEPQQGQEPQPSEQKFEPDATAQEIIDNEQRQKKEREMLQRARYREVDRDW